MCKMIFSLPQSFRYLIAARDSIPRDTVPRDQQTIESLTLRLLKEEKRIPMQDEVDAEGDEAFFSQDVQSSCRTQKSASVEEKKKRAAKIAKIKKKTKYNKCGQEELWKKDAECPENKKEGRSANQD